MNKVHIDEVNGEKGKSLEEKEMDTFKEEMRKRRSSINPFTSVWKEEGNVELTHNFLQYALLIINFIISCGLWVMVGFEWIQGESMVGVWGMSMVLLWSTYPLLAEDGPYLSRSSSFMIFLIHSTWIIGPFVWQAKVGWSLWGILPLYIFFNGVYLLFHFFNFLLHGTKFQVYDPNLIGFIRTQKENLSEASVGWFLEGIQVLGFQSLILLNGFSSCRLGKTISTNMTSTDELKCKGEGLGAYLLNSQLFALFIIHWLSSAMGASSMGELLSFSKASRRVSRLFYGVGVATIPTLIVSLIVPNSSAFNLSYDEMVIYTYIALAVMWGPFLIGSFLYDLILCTILQISYFQTSSDEKSESSILTFSRWSTTPGNPRIQWPPSWNKSISSGPWGTVLWDNSGKKLKVKSWLEFYAVPVKNFEIESDKLIKTPDGERYQYIIHQLNTNEITWNHDYCYLFLKSYGFHVRVRKLTTLPPDPDTSNGKIFKLEEENKSLKDDLHTMQTQLKELSKEVEERIEKGLQEGQEKLENYITQLLKTDLKTD